MTKIFKYKPAVVFGDEGHSEIELPYSHAVKKYQWYDAKAANIPFANKEEIRLTLQNIIAITTCQAFVSTSINENDYEGEELIMCYTFSKNINSRCYQNMVESLITKTKALSIIDIYGLPFEDVKHLLEEPDQNVYESKDDTVHEVEHEWLTAPIYFENYLEDITLYPPPESYEHIPYEVIDGVDFTNPAVRERHAIWRY